MDGFLDLFSLLLAGYGAYFIYQWFQITFRKKPVDVKNFMPTDMTLDKCNDVPAFTAYVSPWLLSIGASLVIYAVVSYCLGNSPWFLAVVIGYFAALIIVYTLMIHSVKKRFWPDLIKKKKEKKGK